jgi:hypothetical protein
MRFLSSVLSLFVMVGTLLCASIVIARADERSGVNLQHEVLREWHFLANGRTEFEISDPALVPRLLVIAAEQSGCDYKLDMKASPVRFVRFEYRRFAIVPCWGFSGSHELFELTNLKKPKLIVFPVFAAEGGFSTSSRPGMLTWKKETGILEAESSSDMGCPGRGRHTYRLSRTQPGLVLTRVEINKDDCGKNEWNTIWEAPPWHELTR